MARNRKPHQGTGGQAQDARSSTPGPSAGRNRTTGQIEMPLEDPLDRPAKRRKHMSKDGKIVSATLTQGPGVILSSIRSFWVILGHIRFQPLLSTWQVASFMHRSPSITNSTSSTTTSIQLGNPCFPASCWDSDKPTIW